MSASERRKGARIECEIVNKHKDLGLRAERYPLSGATHFRNSGHDIDLYIFGTEQAPRVAEVKARGSGNGFALLERWLGDYDALFLRRDRQEPLVVLPWRVWARLIGDENGNARTKARRAPKSEEGAAPS